MISTDQEIYETLPSGDRFDLGPTAGELESFRTHRVIVPSGVWKSEGALSTKGWIVSGSRGARR